MLQVNCSGLFYCILTFLFKVSLSLSDAICFVLDLHFSGTVNSSVKKILHEYFTPEYPHHRNGGCVHTILTSRVVKLLHLGHWDTWNQYLVPVSQAQGSRVQRSFRYHARYEGRFPLGSLGMTSTWHAYGTRTGHASGTHLYGWIACSELNCWDVRVLNRHHRPWYLVFLNGDSDRYCTSRHFKDVHYCFVFRKGYISCAFEC